MSVKNEGTKRIHPGSYIKDEVLPAGLSVKAAAELLDVGRPALSNLLNGNAALSPEMAVRLEKAFGANKERLLEMQAEFDHYEARTRDQTIAVRAYVPSFMKLTARDIEEWADGNLQARSQLAVFLRKLVHATGQSLSHVDFPGYDNAQRKGWDGQVEAGAATPWIPVGTSGWEFGCDQNPKKKAEDDYAARVSAIPPQERSEVNFVFVTPRNWAGKGQWAREKNALREWKSVKAFDASDLEQWLEQSIPTQGWFAEQIGLPSEGAHSLDEQWQRWASVTDPELPTELFAPSVASHKATLKSWIEKDPSSPLVVCADSKAEALAFLYCLFDSDEFATAGYKDRAVVFSSARTLRKLVSSSSPFIPIVFTDEVEHELGGVYRKLHTIIVRPKNTTDVKPDIVLDLLNHEAFSKALKAMGIDDHLRAEVLGRESGRSPTILRRRLSRNPAIRTPSWTKDPVAVRNLIPMMLVGAWHSQSNADCEVLSLLAETSYSELEKQITALLEFDDPPIWRVGAFRGVSSKIDAFFAVQATVTPKDLDNFLFAAEVVLSETDPALDLPEDKRGFAGIYGKTREHSGALREGICETLVLLAVHGNHLFNSTGEINVEAKVDALIRRLLTPLTPQKLLSQRGDLPLYAEAAPDEFLRILEEDLKSAAPQVYALMTPADSGPFGGCPRTGLLWALETLAWAPERLMRVSQILARLSERKITDNWANTPANSLGSIYRTWMPQTAALLEDRKKALETLAKRFPPVAWKICLQQFEAGPGIGNYNHRPRWRSDASGAGQPVSRRECYEFARKALDLALAWPAHDENTLGDLITNLQGLPEEDQDRIWDLINGWAKAEQDQNRRALLRERIRKFAFTRRGKARGIKRTTRDRARETYSLLTPSDVVIRHQWLFTAQWVDESSEELELDNLDFQERDERIRKLRLAALQEIWAQKRLDGVRELVAHSGTAWTIGWLMADGVIDGQGSADFIRRCLESHDVNPASKMDEFVSGFLWKLDAGVRLDFTRNLVAVLAPPQVLRILKCSPFQGDTWILVDDQAAKVRDQYWREIHPGWIGKDSPDLNEVIDRLLEAKRPRAAFQAVQPALEAVETSRLKRLLQEVGSCNAEPAGTYLLDAYRISSALDTLQKRSGVTEEEMARLEFQFIEALDHTDHGIPNLERQLAKSPLLFTQLLAVVFKRSDDGDDPPEWQIHNPEQKQAAFSTAYRLLDRMRRIPGTEENGSINAVELRAWISEARSLCAQYGRADIGDQKIGQILAHAPVGDDGIWPCSPLRDILEEIGSPDIATGMGLGVYNARGVHWRGEGGDQERALAEKYGAWSRQLAFEYPYVANLVGQISTMYNHDAVREDSESAVRRRLGY